MKPSQFSLLIGNLAIFFSFITTNIFDRFGLIFIGFLWLLLAWIFMRIEQRIAELKMLKLQQWIDKSKLKRGKK